jgi:hypothetical protein
MADRPSLEEVSPMCAAYNAGYLEGRLDHETRPQPYMPESYGVVGNVLVNQANIEAAANLVKTARQVLGQ